MAFNLRKRTHISYYEAEEPNFIENKVRDSDTMVKQISIRQTEDSDRMLRQRPRISYYEPEEPSFDEYSFCEECSDYVFEYCAIHGPLLVIPDEKVPPKPNVPPVVPLAALTIPHVFLHLAPSIIAGAGIGVFSTVTLPRGVRFGPYRGQRAAAVDSMYCWQIYDRDNKRSHVVDAADAQCSNWMRYVNCARHWTEQNLVAYQYKGQLYYRTIKIVPRFTELLVFYGSEFANVLRVNLSKYNSPQYYEDKLNASSNQKLEYNLSSVSTKKDIIQQTNGTDEELLNFNDFQIIGNDSQSTQSLIDENSIDSTTTSFVEILNTEENKQLTFQCDKCDKIFSKKKYLSTHYLNHLENPKYQCEECPYRTSLSHSFKRHLQSHANRITYSCDTCIYKTDNKSDFVGHTFQHNSANNAALRGSYYPKAKRCELCPFETYSRKSFQTHMLKHSGLQYQCQFCDYNSYCKSYLRRHIALKHGRK